jgi:hypothetical protein
MKVKVAKEGVMVRLIVNGMPIFVTDMPYEVDENNLEVMEQVETMMKLGWLVEVKEERRQAKVTGGSNKGEEGVQKESE